MSDLIDQLTRPIVGIALRTPEEAFDIMADRIRNSAAIRDLVAKRERSTPSPDAHAEAVAAFRKWYFDHAGKRIFYNNASKAVDLIRPALSGTTTAGEAGTGE